jgi:hypothetical protein
MTLPEADSDGEIADALLLVLERDLIHADQIASVSGTELSR